MSYERLEAAAQAQNLTIMGGFHPDAEDGAPEGCKTLLLVGPHGTEFWGSVQQAPEFNDGAANPLDRWSTRVVSALAVELSATALFPFGGPPFQPFIAWATRAGTAWPSPVGMLVHQQAGMFISFRGALALSEHVTLPMPQSEPCATCARPCATACPIGALTPAGYDVAACKAYLGQPEGQSCLTRGCMVRRACPVSAAAGRTEAQSAFHMRAFLSPDEM